MTVGNNKLLSFHNDQAIKQKYLDRVLAHQAADRIIKGTGWSGSKGCAVGCTLENYNHDRYPIELGLPIWLAHLEDRIFEGLPKEDALLFPAQFLAAIPVGVDLDLVQWKLAIARHTNDLTRLASNKAEYAQECCDAIQKVIYYCQLKLSGSLNATEAARSSAAAAARSSAAAAAARSSAAAAAAWSAAWSASASAARSASSAAESSAAESSAASAASAAESARRSHFQWERDLLLTTLSEWK